MKRRRPAYLALLLLAAALLVSGAPQGAAQVTLPPRGYLPLVYRAYPKMPVGFGIQVHAWDDAQRTLDAARDLGLTWIKQQVRWEYVEKSDDSYSWGETDRIVDAANAAGLQVLFSIVAAPGWARPGKSGVGPPDDDADLADFMGAIAARYLGRVSAYEIWNEQNLKREWEGAPLSAADYVQLLSAAHRAVQAADPGATVVSGGLAPTGINDGVRAVDDRRYLREMYQAGLGGACDAVGAHPYGFANPPEVYFTGGDYDPTRGWDEHPSFFFRNTLEDYYAIMVEHGDAGKRIWATEFGWPTVDGMGVPPNPGFEYAADIDQAQQASYIVGGYQWAAEWGHAAVLTLWNLNFWPVVGPENEMAKFSVVRGDWSPRPAYTAIKAMPR
jgi:hypothetical protein